MTVDLIIVIAVTIAALVMFITELVRVDVVAMLTLAVLWLTGILTPEEGIQGFGNEATITIAAMFVLSEALRQTGALNAVGNWLGDLFEEHYYRALIALMFGAAVTSAFINNVAVVAIMLPVMLGVCRRVRISPTKLLIPLSFGAMFGGTMTLIGTSANLVVSGLMVDEGLDAIGMFELTPVGIAFVFVGIGYLLIAQRWLPERTGGEDLEETYELGEFRADLQVLPGHEEIGCRASAFFAPHENAQILGVLRNGILIAGPLDDIRLEDRDVLRVSASARMVRRLDEREDMRLLPLEKLHEEAFDARQRQLELFEVVVPPDSPFIGKTLREIGFTRRHPGVIIALRRAGQVVVENLMEVPIRGGDVLLMQAEKRELRQLQKSADFIVVSEVGLPKFKEHLTVPVVAGLAAVVLLAAVGWLPIVNLAVAVAVIFVVIGALNAEEAYRAIDWQVIFLLGGFIPLGTALEKTGAIAMLAGGLVGALGDYGPFAILAGFYLATNFLSDVVSNNATAVLMLPLAVATATVLGVDPRPFAVAVAFACSASFASPIGYHTNVMIYSAGNYRFLDFVKVGVPLNLLFLSVAVILIPLVWGF